VSITPDTVKLFDIWNIDDLRHTLDVLHGPDAMVIALDEAVSGNRIHQGAGTYAGDLNVWQSDFMIQGQSPVADKIDGDITLLAGTVGDVLDQLWMLGATDVSASSGTRLTKNIFEGDVSIADDTQVVGCQFRNGARLVTPEDGMFNFANGRATHSVTMLLGLDGHEHMTVTGWASGLDHLDLSETDLSVVGVAYGRRDTMFTLSNGDTVDIGMRHASL
jgi:hypothetical protein